MEGNEKAVRKWLCTFCGSPHDTEKQAEQCWNSHTELTIDYIFGGIGGGEMPHECIIKKHERGRITKIATYKKVEVRDVNIMEKRKKDEEKEK